MPFEKGKSGNPGGRSTEQAFTNVLRAELNQKASGDRLRLQNVVKALVAKAETGDVGAIKEIADRLEGRAVQQIESHNINENHYVRAPEKAAKDDWQKYLDHKAKPAPIPDKPARSTNGSSNGKSH